MKETVEDRVANLKEYISTLDTKNSDNITDEQLLKVKTDFSKIYEDLMLFLVSKKDSYYGYFLMNMQLEVNFYEDCIAGVTYVDHSPIPIIINPFLFMEFTMKEMLFVLCHEIEHLVLNHPSEAKRVNPTCEVHKNRLLNYAMDCSINERLKHEIQVNERFNYLSVPKDLIDKKVIEKMAKQNKIKDLESYLYYYQFIKDIPGPKYITFGIGNSNNNSSDNSNTNSDNGTGNNSGGNGRRRKVITKENSVHAGEFVYKLTGDSGYIKDVIKDFVRNANAAISERNRGLMPAYQLSQIEAILSPPKIDWKKLLKQYVGNIPVPFKKSRTRLNRRQPLRSDLSGRVSDHTIKIVVAIDTSGSMSDEDIKNVMIEIFNIVKNRKHEITIIECDAEINKVYVARTLRDVETKVSGRGGTSFVPVIEYINQRPYFRDSVLVYFTDGYGDEEIPRPKTYRNLWVILQDVNYLSLREPYGKVMPLKTD